MAFRLKRYRFSSDQERSTLNGYLIDFYKNTPDSYYRIADSASLKYNYQDQPFHLDLCSLSKKGDHVLEVGCGTAHLCPHILKNGAIYHGLDISSRLITENRAKFPTAYFYTLADPPRRNFDVVASLYTIEHTVYPYDYLKSLWDFCRPGGLIAIICPDFIDGKGIPQSVYFGKSPRRIREKFCTFSFLDIFQHIFEILFVFPIWKIYARLNKPGSFWINFDPSDLAGREHTIDGDAVHFPRLLDLIDWFHRMGASVIKTSHEFDDIPSEIKMHNCYIVAVKKHSE
jgi:SAM-dependent methyltransferase